MNFVRNEIEHFSSWFYLMGSFSTWLVQPRIKAKNSAENPCRRFYFTISIALLHVLLTLHPSTPNWMNFLEHYRVFWSIRETSQASSSKVSLETFLLPISIAVLRSVLVTVHFLVRSIGIFFDNLLIEQRWNANLAHSRLRFSKPMSQLSTGVRPPSVLDYKACLE